MAVYAMCGLIGCDMESLASQVATHMENVTLVDAATLKTYDEETSSKLVQTLKTPDCHIIFYGHQEVLHNELIQKHAQYKIFAEMDLDSLFSVWLRAQDTSSAELLDAAIERYMSKVKPENEDISKQGKVFADLILPRGTIHQDVVGMLTTASLSKDGSSPQFNKSKPMPIPTGLGEFSGFFGCNKEPKTFFVFDHEPKSLPDSSPLTDDSQTVTGSIHSASVY